MSVAAVSRLGRLALDLLYPPLCALCGRGGGFVCPECEASLPRADGPRCGRCWLPSPRIATGGYCRHCEAFPLALTALRSAYRYEGPARELVHRFKFRDLSALAGVMAPPMAAMVTWPVDAVVPVPLAGGRERRRGYNQSRLLAKGVGQALAAPLLEALRRPRAALPQVKAASRDQRIANVRGAFVLRVAAEAVAGRTLLLVDDVATTGATLDSCTRALLDAGAGEVGAVTFARED